MLTTPWRKAIRFASAFFLLVLINFLLPRLLPGDPLMTLFGEEAIAVLDEPTRQSIAAKLCLDQTLPLQFLHYVQGLCTLNLGYSHHHGADVTTIIADFAPWTFLLTGLSLTFSNLLGTVFGIYAAWLRSRPFDRAGRLFAMFLNSFPPFVLALLLLRWLAIDVGLFPLSGGQSLVPPDGLLPTVVDLIYHAALPAMALVLHETPNLFLLIRSEALRWMGKPFVFVCRSKGVADQTIRFKHLGACVTPAILSNAGKSVPAYMGGVMFVEIVFSYPGLGMLIYDSLQQHDYAMVQGALLLVGTTALLFNATADSVADILHRRATP